MANYFELFDDTRAGMLGAIDRATTEARAWEFLRYWEPEWEMVPLPSIEQRLPNRDAYDDDMFHECFNIIWTIARTDWIQWRESYIAENPPCMCRQRAGKLAGYCWPRYPEEDERAMCEEIRNYYDIVQDNEQVTRLVSLDNAITERGDWEYWATDDLENWEVRTNSYGIHGVTEEDMRIICGIAERGFESYVRSLDADLREYLAEWRRSE